MTSSQVNPSAPHDPGPKSSTALSRIRRSVDSVAFVRASLGVVVGGLVVFGGYAATEANDPVEQQEVVQTNVAPQTDLLSSWPAGPLAGPAPALESGQTLRPDGCVDAGPSEEVVLLLNGAGSVWVFADPSATVNANWRDDDGTQSFVIPQAHFEHPFTTGRVTLSNEAPTSPTLLSIRSSSDVFQVCGIDSSVG